MKSLRSYLCWLTAPKKADELKSGKIQARCLYLRLLGAIKPDNVLQRKFGHVGQSNGAKNLKTRFLSRKKLINTFHKNCNVF